VRKGKRVSVWFQDEARIGQKGRVCHIWWKLIVQASVAQEVQRGYGQNLAGSA
jgi:hypothetical protein